MEVSVSVLLSSGTSTRSPPLCTILSWFKSAWGGREGGREGRREREGGGREEEEGREGKRIGEREGGREGRKEDRREGGREGGRKTMTHCSNTEIEPPHSL